MKYEDVINFRLLFLIEFINKKFSISDKFKVSLDPKNKIKEIG